MTLHIFEAIRELKEGQEIRFRLDGDWILIAKLDWGSKGVPTLVNCGGSDWLNREVTIIDLPKPKVLYDVLVDECNKKAIGIKREDCKRGSSETCLQVCSLPLIDTLQDIALAAGFNLKKITAEEDK